MGNCLHHDSTMQWGGDDWGSSSSYSINAISHDNYEKEERELLQECSKNNKEVKIKISKKQLAELLGRVFMDELSIDQVLAQLVNITDTVVSNHNRPWKPNLQTIPE
ncbi:hypothetical protein M5689_014311 [Euphorbia peplus]|nr:hypothetical protein M5689_014311 [Euphorbia peplus]